ncbi:MAG: hypothetical protein ACF8GE_08310 [Phycisphaerales bacterium JB043]
MPDPLEHELDALAPPTDTPPLPDAITARTRAIRRQRDLTTTALTATPLMLAIVAVALWMSFSTTTSTDSPAHTDQVTTNDPQPLVIPLTEATPIKLLQINKDLDPENLTLPRVYTHTTSTPVPTPSDAIRTERSDPPSR